MRIIYLHQYFFTPNMVGVAGTRSYELGKRLVERGHEVHMVTSATNPTDLTSPDWYETREAGVHVHWLPVPYSNKMSFRRRIRAFSAFARKSSAKASSLKGDIVYATSGPLTIALPALFVALRNRIPLVFEVRDLWPEGAIQLKVLTNPIAIAFARLLERATYRLSKHIVALSPGMKAGIVETGIAPEKVSVIPNACDLDLFNPLVDGSAMRKAFQIENRFSIAYFGTMGIANGLEFVLDAASILIERGVDDVVIILHGDGMQRQSLEKRAKETGLTNVIFADPVPEKEKIAELAAAVDVCMTIYANVPVLATCSPNKLFDSLSAGKPCIANMPGAVQRLLEENDCGISVTPDDPNDFADKVIFLRDASPERLSQMGKNARALGERTFSRDALASKLGTILEVVQSTGRSPHPPIPDDWQ